MRRGNNAEHTPYLPNPLSTSPGNAEIGHMGTRICALTSCVGSGDVCRLFPQPMHSPIALRLLDFFIEGVSETKRFQCLNSRFGLSSVLIGFGSLLGIVAQSSIVPGKRCHNRTTCTPNPTFVISSAHVLPGMPRRISHGVYPLLRL